MQPFPLSDVRLDDGVFRRAQRADLEYLLALDPDRLLAPFRRTAGLPPVAPPYGNWESSGLDGHTAGHAISAASLLVAATGDGRVADVVARLVAGLAACQDALGTGYVGGIPDGVALWERVVHGRADGNAFDLGGAWVPLYNLHKTLAGLVDAARYARPDDAARALAVARGLGDWWLALTADVDDDAFERLLTTEFGGMGEALADLGALVDDPRLLTAALRFADRSLLEPSLAGRDALDGRHANTQIPKVVAWARFGELTGDATWTRAARAFWDAVVGHRTLAFGGNSVREHFHARDDFLPALTSPEGPETCNTTNMLELTRHLLLADPDPALVDHHEIAQVNHVLSAQHPDGGFVYFTPARPGHYRVYSQPEQGFWCCVGTSLEVHARHGELALAHDRGDLRVLLPIPVTLRWAARDAEVRVRSPYPDVDPDLPVEVHLRLASAQAFGVHVRVPGWHEPGADLDLRVGGATVAATGVDALGVVVRRTWRDGDVLTYRLTPRTVVERLPDGSPWVAVRRGPVVLAARDGDEDLVGLRADDARMGHIAAGALRPLADAPVLVADDEADLAAALEPAGAPMRFRLPAGDGSVVELEPFHALHDSRYTLYFPLADRVPGAVDARRRELAALDAADADLARRTVDAVRCGEQQPEVEHALAAERSTTGSRDGELARAAEGWFSYDLSDAADEGAVLRLTWRGEGAATVEVDGERVGAVGRPVPAGPSASAGATVPRSVAELVLPPGAPRDRGETPGVRRVRLTADGATTPEVVEVRLLRRPPLTAPA
ncbi:beta-L-arabinofuranosidase domain-containing protein [Cellulomonas endophytica]|uniref:beta-L-arabinofuranosidase domain-containing protein n=1 Tax=Cellulomonas endophytica TaxID=2494735 RepID=UPI0010112073|nr:beta-L-arabinofuranosidase domain-containing protein [Cellulomonas endophytica]